MNKLLTILLTSLITLPGFAGTSANVGFSSDYIWRGMTQTSGDPAMFGGFDFAAESGFYAGIWGSNVSFSEGAGNELDTYLGYNFAFGDIDIDVNYVNFGYPGDSGLDFQEIGVALSYSDFGIAYYSGQDGAPDYMDLSYSIGAFSLSYGDYDSYGTNYAFDWAFLCGSYNCALTYSDFSSDSIDLIDENAFVFSITTNF
tara:strand:+ start:799 stop:1398 length:600 start_codon:yes stop_codon:yes gene_type:complete